MRKKDNYRSLGKEEDGKIIIKQIDIQTFQINLQDIKVKSHWRMVMIGLKRRHRTNMI